MGNDQSHLSGLSVEEKAVEVTDFWTHHSATLSASNSAVSVFIGEPLVGGSLWVSQTPLEKASKNLMLHRHPCILRYVSSWSKGSKYYLAVEKVKPLSHALQTQSVLQICIGLHSVLKALVFLHERASSSHNNVCTASIYVTKDGSWKLGGFEYLCKFSDITKDYMSKSRAHRYVKAIDPNEDKHLSSQQLHFIDVYAFAVLVNEVFKNIKGLQDETIPLQEFLELCKNNLQHMDVHQRPTLSSLLEDGFFNHDFIAIHSFLMELPLKSDAEKDAFFCSLIDRLRCHKQDIVAKQLGGLLLSRMVLLNKTAQNKVIPELFTLKSVNANALFDAETFKQQIVPTLLEIFCVRDAQIRLLLLEYLNNFVSCFTKEQLQNKILPELLLGIKDTNDHLVAVTLRSLADLVPILGSAVVIGGKRAKLFNDGLPMVRKSVHPASRRNSTRHHHSVASAGTAVIPQPVAQSEDVLSNSSGTETHGDLIPNERPSPDGEEGDTSTITDEAEDAQVDVDASAGYPNNEVWDDWEINDTEANDSPMRALSSHDAVFNLTRITQSSLSDLTLTEHDEDAILANVTTVQVTTSNSKTLPDIFELDIKNVKNRANSEEFDFFQDMEPVINTSTKYLVSQERENESDGYNRANVEHKHAIDWSVKNPEHQEEGWGDDLDGWD